MIIGNREKSDLKKSIQKNYPHLIDDQKDKPNASMTPTTDKLFGDYSRAMVKIADGCNQHCAYCIVPRVRGKFYSLEANDIMDEINALVANGFHEVVLTAVHIGKYNSNGLNLAGLIDKILDETKLARLRLSSLEPNELDGQLIELVAGHPRVCRHLHLPLQSGSDKILESMQRPYRKNDYLRIIEKIKNHNEDITVGCDLIVGFPGETETDFKESLEILDSGYLDYSHVFSYSDRPGTVASRMTGKINVLTIKERNRIARELIHKRKIIHYMSQLDKELCVIPELVARKDGFVNALSDNYIKIKISPDSPRDRKILKVRSNRLAEKGEKNICLTGDVVA
jgi:threonylcarbamoyladenosine tRNA methylthiotransferase MtaB